LTYQFLFTFHIPSIFILVPFIIILATMVSAPELPGLEVTVEVAGEVLPEFEHDAPNANHSYLQHQVATYIESPAGTQFEIRTLYKAPYDPPLPIHVEIMLDGNYVQAPYLEPGGKEGCEGYKYGKATFMEAGEAETRKFCFAALTTGECCCRNPKLRRLTVDRGT
jgi:hypothetical protein